MTPTDDDFDEFCIFWWGSDNDERTVTDVIESGSMAAFAGAVLDRWGGASDETSKIVDYYSRLAAQHAGKAVFHDPNA